MVCQDLSCTLQSLNDIYECILFFVCIADSDDSRVVTHLRSGLLHCITTYCALGSHGLSRYIGAPMSLIVFIEQELSPHSPHDIIADVVAPLATNTHYKVKVRKL